MSCEICAADRTWFGTFETIELEDRLGVVVHSRWLLETDTFLEILDHELQHGCLQGRRSVVGYHCHDGQPEAVCGIVGDP